MTTETRTTISPDDIKAVEIECTKCHFRIVRPAGSVAAQELSACPGCGVAWIPYRETLSNLRNVVFQLRSLSNPPSQADGVPFSIRFEISGDKK
jgi:hypothetical protein